jgi:proteasome lid subunit RPN8/RPN11
MVFSQLALKRTREHATSAVNAPVGGILIGRVHEDPTWGRRWVLVEDALRAREPLPEDPSAEALEAALAELIESAATGRVVGWYRTHARRGVYLSEEEARLHQNHFGQPWQCALILVGNEQHPVGGVFQPTEDQELSRSVYNPFFELVDASSEFSTAWKRTFVGWSNYQTETSVALAGKAGVSTALPSDAQLEPAAEPVVEPVATRVEEPVATPALTPVAQPVVSKAPPAPAPEVAREPAPEVAPEVKPEVTTEPTPESAPSASTGADIASSATGEGDSPEAEEEWSEVQIRRSLSAVGRTLGPSGLSTPSSRSTRRMAPVELEKKAVEPDRPPVAGDTAPAATDTPPEKKPVEEAAPPRKEPQASVVDRPEPVIPERVPSEPVDPGPTRSEAVTPLPLLPDPPGPEMRSTLVGRSRRRSRMPVRTIVGVAAGLFAVLGGGWLVQDRLGRSGDVTIDDSSAPPEAASDAFVEESGTSIAGLGLGQGPLFQRGSDDGDQEDPDLPENIEAPIGPERFDGGSDATLGASGGPSTSDGAGGTALPESGEPDSETGQTPSNAGESTEELQGSVDPAERSGANPPSGGEGAETLDTTIDLSLSAISLDDPAVAAFEDAFTIFRKEVSRYDGLRTAFDDQLEGCNALNQSYRVVGESFARLGNRFEAAREHFAGPGLQAFRNAQRQAAVIDRHYELTECPPPVGG